MDHLVILTLAREHQAGLLAQARAEQLAGPSRGVDDRPGPERPPRRPSGRRLVHVARGLSRRLAPAR